MKLPNHLAAPTLADVLGSWVYAALAYLVDEAIRLHDRLPAVQRARAEHDAHVGYLLGVRGDGPTVEPAPLVLPVIGRHRPDVDREAATLVIRRITTERTTERTGRHWLPDGIDTDTDTAAVEAWLARPFRAELAALVGAS